MKYSTAQKQAKGSIKFLSVVVPCVWALFIWLRFWPVAAVASFMTIYLVMDIRVLLRIKRGLAQDPEFLKKKLPGT
jgi:hypothetical protein